MTGRVFIRGARVLTMGTGPGPRRGAALGDLVALDACDIEFADGVVTTIGPGLSAPAGAEVIDARGRVVMPAFVDCHTHACWAGDRLDEWVAKLGGATYLELLEAGGGIMSTVRSVRAASDDLLAESLAERLRTMRAHGTGACEVKSGYGLTTTDELRMLRAVVRAGRETGMPVSPTACIGHAIDPGEPSFVERTIAETLPAVSAEFPGIPIDAYCEQGAWSLADCLRLFDRAAELGHPARIHADQFNDLGMIPEAVSHGFMSVDHLEASTPEHLRALAESGTFGVMLPCSGWHTDGRYADGRAYVDAGGALAIATNYNPGSSPCGSMATAIALAVRHLGLTPGEAIVASTANPAALLGLEDRGRITVGGRADLVMLRHTDERMLAYEFGMNPVERVFGIG
ncbi:MAG: imidazolonepropionase [Phycisphaeraceae bacterium]|nr:MAG: imidazolonepropionase [Phycisphaeraceae bacterium]